MAGFELIAMGDAHMVVQVLEGIAILTGGGSYLSMVKVAMIVGLLFGGAKAIFTGSMDLRPMIIGFFFYTVLFVPKVTVYVVDPYGNLPSLLCGRDTLASNGSGENASRCDNGIPSSAGGVIAVDNVPIGVAFPYYVATQIGATVTELYTQVFGCTNMYQKGDGYLSGTRILAKLNGFNGGSNPIDGAGDKTVGTFRIQLADYWKECVKYDIDSGKKTIESIQKNPDIFKAIESTNVNVDVKNHFPTSNAPTEEQKSCAEMSTMLTAMSTDTNTLAAIAMGAEKQGISTTTAMQDGIDDLIAASAFTASQLMLNSMASNTLKCAMSGMTAQDCVMLTQAGTQRQAQWTAEQSMFKQVMRPIMSFMEMFALAATPIMAVLIASGFGMALASKYFQLMAWIALWPVSMALCNIYIYSAASRALMSSIPDASNPSSMLSMVGLENVFTTAADWVATGSMMASATPVLTMFLITGSAQALSSIAGRMQGGDHLNEKIAAPDLMSPAARVQGQSAKTLNPTLGGLHTGQESNLDQIQIGQTAQASLTNNRSIATEASSSFTKNYGSEAAKSIQRLDSTTDMSSFMKSSEKSMTTQQQKSMQTARENLVKAGVTERDADSIMQKGAVKASVGLNVFGMGVGSELSAETTKGKTKDQMKAIEDSWRQASSIIESNSSAFKTASTTQSGKTVMKAVSEGYSGSDKEGFQKSLGMATKANEQVQESESTASTMAASGNKSALAWASAMNGGLQGGQVSKDGKSVLDKAASLGLGGEVNRISSIYQAQGMDKNMANIAGAGMAIQGAALKGNSEALSAMNAFNMKVSGVTPGVRTPQNTLGESGFQSTMVQGATAKTGVEEKVAGIDEKVAPAQALQAGKPTEPLIPKSTATGTPKHAATPAASGSQPTPKVSDPSLPTSTAPTPESLVSPGQVGFGQRVDERMKQPNENMSQIVDRMPALASTVADGVGHAAGSVVDYAKKHPIQTAATVAGVAAAAMTGGVGGIVARQGMKKVATYVGPKIMARAAPGAAAAAKALSTR